MPWLFTACRARPRTIDILLHADKNNAKRIIAALQDFGFGAIGFKEDDFEQERFFFRMGRPPQQIDLLTRIPGVSWQQVWDNKIVGKYGDTKVNVIGRQQFIKAKRSSGRIQDLGDVERLGEEV